MLEREDRMAVRDGLIPGRVAANALPEDVLSNPIDPAAALGAAIALRTQAEGSVVIAPIRAEQTKSESFPTLLRLAEGMCLPIVFLMECDEDFPDDLQAQAALDDVEYIHADGQDAMRLMPAIRLGIDKAREGDGTTLIECAYDPQSRMSPADRLAQVLITEGYATPEELL
jgi:TPP-dependent pyruvate/acetoin dehydrogenase alpha subunit